MSEEHQIKWLEGAFPIQTQSGLLRLSYLPIYHVVVYGYPIKKTNSHKSQYIAYYGPWGKMHCQSKEDLNKFINSTRYGISEILLGEVFNIKDLPTTKELDIVSIRMYIILKKLISENGDYIKEAISLSEIGNKYRLNQWIYKILSDSILAPSLPELNPNYPEEFYSELNTWYEENKNNITFTNNCIFSDSNTLVSN